MVDDVERLVSGCEAADRLKLAESGRSVHPARCAIADANSAFPRRRATRLFYSAGSSECGESEAGRPMRARGSFAAEHAAGELVNRAA